MLNANHYDFEYSFKYVYTIHIYFFTVKCISARIMMECPMNSIAQIARSRSILLCYVLTIYITLISLSRAAYDIKKIQRYTFPHTYTEIYF